MRHVFAAIIRLYQLAISPYLPRSCRFVPSCSAYGREALLTHGALSGGLLLLWRLARCHPWGGHGYDPVPQHLPWNRFFQTGPDRAAPKAGIRR